MGDKVVVKGTARRVRCHDAAFEKARSSRLARSKRATTHIFPPSLAARHEIMCSSRYFYTDRLKILFDVPLNAQTIPYSTPNMVRELGRLGNHTHGGFLRADKQARCGEALEALSSR